ncbi:Ankyrin repeat protein [Aspergillus sclerotialis]|uniref:Ankyrin repeat protein n=1 Tax=Aspergillus sclerotialis TaxID=2070753 RepID=A0A3A2ZNR9_9EURO|nr:Ankyrin repeat protein [Aspergillus sclerotialis]
MAESLGIASGVTGITSLGLEVTKGLLKFYAAWRDRDKDINSMYNSLSNLSEVLVQLQRKIQPPAKFNIGAKRTVERGLEAALDNLKRLETELGKVRAIEPLPQAGIRTTMRRHVLRMKYPFKVETLRKIQTNVSESRANLLLTMQLLHIDTFSEVTEKADLIIRWRQDWLSDTNFWSKQADVLKQRQPGTGEWLLQDPDFLDWETGSREILWCRGSPGVGKTVLSSVIVDFLETDLPASDISLTFIYCNHKSSQAQSLEYFLRAIVRQLVELERAIPESVSELYQRHRGKGTAPTKEECVKLLQSISQVSAETFVVIDALDECVGKEGLPFWTELIKTLKGSIVNLRLLCTSRHIDDPRGVLKNALRIEIRASRADIETYTEEKIKSNDNLMMFCEREPRLQQNIMEEVGSKSDGMFLIAQLYIESLGAKQNLRAVKKSLKTLPGRLDDLYDDAMQRLRSSPTAQLALRVISWIVHSFRPLRFIELQHAVAIDELEEDDKDIPDDCLTDQTLIINACVGLIRIDMESQTIGLVHYTTYDYFKQKGSVYFPNAQMDLGVACMRYLKLGTFSSGSCSTAEQLNRRLIEHPLLEYASSNFCAHIRPGLESKEIQQLSLQLFLDRPRISCASQVLLDVKRYGAWSPIARDFQGIHYAADFGLSLILPSLMEAYDVNLRDDQGRTPLSYAAERGQEDTVKLLLDHDAQLDSEDRYCRTPLSSAAYTGRESIVKLLLEYGARLDSKDENGWTPLSLAVTRGHESIVKLLLEYGARPDSKVNHEWTPLSFAATNGHEPIVKILLDNGARPDSEDEDGLTPLHFAVDGGYESVVEILLEYGARIDPKDKEGLTPLSLAAILGRESIAKLLLEYGARPDSKGKDGGTPLLYAVANGHDTITKLLKENGARSDSEDNDGRAPIFGNDNGNKSRNNYTTLKP